MLHLAASHNFDAPTTSPANTSAALANAPPAPVSAPPAPVSAPTMASISGTVQVNVTGSTSAAVASLAFTPAVPTPNSRGTAAGGNNNFTLLNSDPESEDPSPPAKKKGPGRPKGTNKRPTRARG